MSYNRNILLKTLIIVSCTLSYIFISQDAVGAENKEFWSVRCNGDKPPANSSKRGKCEIFQRLVMKESSKRLIEFAISFPAKKSEPANGIVILPLGIILAHGAKIQVDDGGMLKFNARYCAPDGCYAYIILNNKNLDSMRKGNVAKLSFVIENNKVITIPLPLAGFTKALREIS